MTSGCVKKMYGTLFSVSPFSGRIRGGMRPGKKIIVMGIVNPEPDRYVGHTHQSPGQKFCTIKCKGFHFGRRA